MRFIVLLAPILLLAGSITAAAQKRSSATTDSEAQVKETAEATPRPRKKSATATETTRTASGTSKSTSTKSATTGTKLPGGTPAPASSTGKKKTSTQSTAAKKASEGQEKTESETEKGATARSTTGKSSALKKENTSPESENGSAAAKTTAADDPAAPSPSSVGSAANASIAASDLIEFDAQPPRVRQLIEAALALTRQNLTYTYGSADPGNGGMDCSGFVYYLLREQGFADVPRASNEQYVWVRKADAFQAVLSKKKESFELDDLQPGDLLFWTGTYSIERDPPITHSMIYLGTERRTKQRVMVGSSDGRTYRGKARWGVSVFDFQGGQTSKDPTKAARGGFVGYASIPGLRS